MDIFHHLHHNNRILYIAFLSSTSLVIQKKQRNPSSRRWFFFPSKSLSLPNSKGEPKRGVDLKTAEGWENFFSPSSVFPFSRFSHGMDLKLWRGQNLPNFLWNPIGNVPKVRVLHRCCAKNHCHKHRSFVFQCSSSKQTSDIRIKIEVTSDLGQQIFGALPCCYSLAWSITKTRRITCLSPWNFHRIPCSKYLFAEKVTWGHNNLTPINLGIQQIGLQKNVVKSSKNRKMGEASKLCYVDGVTLWVCRVSGKPRDQPINQSGEVFTDTYQ